MPVSRARRTGSGKTQSQLSNQNSPAFSLNSLEALDLPFEITERYHAFGVTRMFDWQAECLRSESAKTGKSFVICAPTSAGKTFIADITTIRQLQSCGRKVIIVLPFISVAREKLVWLENLLHPIGYRIGGYMGPQHPSLPFEKLNVAICTIEKANSLINSMIRENKISDIGLIIVDELHTICDSSRGYLLELLLTKILFVTAQSPSPPQILGMSATLPNAPLLSRWLKAELYITDYRPVPLTEYIKCGNQLLDKENQLVRQISPISFPNITDEDNTLSLCVETLIEGQSVLIFCPAKVWCERLAKNLAKELNIIRVKKHPVCGGRLLEPANLAALEEVAIALHNSPAGLDRDLQNTLAEGVAFHHAGLTMDERDIIESAYRRQIIRILVATTTLSSGVNLPSRRVIIRSVMTGGSQPVDVLTYKQMAGRAGRKGVDSLGESVLICAPNQRHIAATVVKAELPPLRSNLAIPGRPPTSCLKRAILEVIGNGMASTKEGLIGYVDFTLWGTEQKEDGNSQAGYAILEDCVKYLLEYKFIQMENTENASQRYIPTQLGLAALHSSMPPDEALHMIGDLGRAREALRLDTELHLVYLVTPSNPQWADVNWNVLSGVWDTLPSELRAVGKLVGVNDGFIARAVAGRVSSAKPNDLRIHLRYFVSLMIFDLINEMPLVKVVQKFCANKGFVQSVQQQAATYAGMTSAFCHELGWRHFDTLLSSFQSRIAFGVQAELVDLLQIPYLTSAVARHVYKNGLRKVEELALCDPQRLEIILLRFRPFDNNQQQQVAEDDQYVASEIPLTDRPSVTPGQAAKLFVDLAKEVFKSIHGENVQLVLPNQNKSESSQRQSQRTSQRRMNASKKRDSSQLISPADRQQSPIASSSSEKRHKSHRSVASFVSPSPVAIGQSTLDLFQSSLNGTCNGLFTPVLHGVALSQHSQPVRMSQSRLSVGSMLGDASMIEIVAQIEDEVMVDQAVNSAIKERSPPAPKRNLRKKGGGMPAASSTPAQTPGDLMPPPPPLTSNNRASIADAVAIMSKTDGSMKYSPISDSLMARLADDCEDDESFVLGLENSPKQPVKQDSDPKPAPPITPLGFPSKVDKKLETAKSTSVSKKVERNQAENVEVKTAELVEPIVPSVHVVEVCADKALLGYFVKEWAQQPDFSISVACAKIRPDSLKGANDLNLPLEEKLRVVGLAVCYGEEPLQQVYYINLKPAEEIAPELLEGSGDASFQLNEHLDGSLTVQKRIDAIKRVLESRETKTVTAFDARRHLRQLYQIGVSPRDCFFDPQLACWVLDPAEKSVAFHGLVLAYCNKNLVNLVAAIQGCKARASISFGETADVARRNACVEAFAVRPLMRALREKLKSEHMNLLKAFEEIETPLDALTGRMEMNGIGLDRNALENLRKRMQMKLVELEKEAREKSGGRSFALSNLDDVSKILFQDLRLPMDPDFIKKVGGKTVCATNKTVLSRLRHRHPLPDIIMQWRRLDSCLKKSVDGILEQITDMPKAFPAPGCRVFYECALIATGRISVVKPCLQLVPKDIPAQASGSASVTSVSDEVEGDDTGDAQTDAALAPFSLRHVFVPFSGCVLLTADYSQIELRLIGHFSKDEKLCAALQDKNVDVFCQMAADWNNLAGGWQAVTDEQRARTKQLVYAMLYGIGTRSLAQSLAVSEQTAQGFVSTFQARFPEIRKFIARAQQEASLKGYVTTLGGRRRMIGPASRREKISAKNPNDPPPHLTEAALRQAVNSVVQGSAADIVKIAMLKIENVLAQRYSCSMPPLPYAGYLNSQTQSRNVDFRGARLVLHMHDELVYEVDKRDLDQVVNIVRHHMEEAFPLEGPRGARIPMPVKVRYGSSWAAQNPVVEHNSRKK